MNNSGAILFYSPEAGITPHFSAQCLVAKTLQERGHPVVFGRCHGMFARCPVMDMYLLPYEATTEVTKQACVQCLHASKVILDQYGLPSLDLMEYLSPEAGRRVGLALRGLGEDLQEFAFDGIEFGRLCMHDLVLATKVSDFRNLSQENRLAWTQLIKSAVVSYVAVGELCRRVPIRGIVVHNDYAILMSARLAAERHGVPACSLGFASHLVVDRRRIMFMRGGGRASDQTVTRNWGRYRELPLPEEKVALATDDILARLGARGGHVYSPAKTFGRSDLRARLGFPADRKLLVAYTSSLDERLACNAMMEALHLPNEGRVQPFADQVEWLRELTGFVEARDDFYLAVRIHPREGANKRESRVSQHLQQLRGNFDRPFRNCRFFWPEDTVSSYDLGEAADLALTSWSTIGIELARLGVPVLTSTHGMAPWPVDDFQEWGETREAYFRKLQDMAGFPTRPDALVHAYRWYNLHVLGRCLSFDDVVPAHDQSSPAPYRTPREGEATERILIGGEDVLDLDYSRLQAVQSGDAAVREELALKRQVRRILHYLFTGEDDPGDYRLVLAYQDADARQLRNAAGGRGADAEAWIVVGGSFATYFRGDIECTRYSPMAARLAAIAAHAVYSPRGPVPDRAVVASTPEDLARLLRNPAPGRDAGASSGVINSRMREMVRLRDSGRIAEAGELAARYSADHPDCPDLLNLRGCLEAAAGREESAFGVFSGIARRWPGYAKARSNLGVMLWKKGDRAGACEHVAAAVAGEPHNREVVLNAVSIYRAAGNESEAGRLAAAYLRTRGEDAAVRRALGGNNT